MASLNRFRCDNCGFEWTQTQWFENPNGGSVNIAADGINPPPGMKWEQLCPHCRREIIAAVERATRARRLAVESIGYRDVPLRDELSVPLVSASIGGIPSVRRETRLLGRPVPLVDDLATTTLREALVKALGTFDNAVAHEGRAKANLSQARRDVNSAYEAVANLEAAIKALLPAVRPTCAEPPTDSSGSPEDG